MRGLTKGREELTKMTTKYLLRVPIIFILLTHREYGPSFLRAVLAILRDSPLDELDSDILIHESKSSNWHIYEYGDEASDEKGWFTLLKSHAEDVVHWWRQFGFNREC